MSLRTAGTLATLVLLAAGVASCGSGGPSGTSPQPSSSHGQVTPPHDFVRAKQVTVLRSGGIRGERTTRVFALGRKPPPGYSADEVDDVLRAAADPDLKSVRPNSPRSSCCDRYVYRVTVQWPDGTSRTFTSVEGTAQPGALAHLLRLVA